jgi:hypothetical protein
VDVGLDFAKLGHEWPLLAVAIITWGGVLLYVGRLELMARQLRAQLQEQDQQENPASDTLSQRAAIIEEVP